MCFFPHFRPRDATRGNSFFQMSSYARANVRITNEKNKRKIPMRASRGLKWKNKTYKLKRSIASISVVFLTLVKFLPSSPASSDSLLWCCAAGQTLAIAWSQIDTDN